MTGQLTCCYFNFVLLCVSDAVSAEMTADTWRRGVSSRRYVTNSYLIIVFQVMWPRRGRRKGRRRGHRSGRRRWSRRGRRRGHRRGRRRGSEEDAEEDAEADAEDGVEEDAEEDAEENLIRLFACYSINSHFLFSCAVTSTEIGRRSKPEYRAKGNYRFMLFL